MTNVNHDKLQPTVEDARREWICPSVHRMHAGSAEDGGGTTPDSGIEPS